MSSRPEHRIRRKRNRRFSFLRSSAKDFPSCHFVPSVVKTSASRSTPVALSRVLARLARRRSRFTPLPRSRFGRRSASRTTNRRIRSPAIGKNLPCPGRLLYQDNQIFAPLFTALSHGHGYQHFAPAQIERDIAHDFHTQRFHLYVSQPSLEQRDQKFPNRRQAANRRNAGAYKRCVGGVELKQVVDMFRVAGLSPVLDKLPRSRLGTPASYNSGRAGRAALRHG